MTPKSSHTWTPIEDLPPDWQHLAYPEVKALVDAWLAQAERVRRSASYEVFLAEIKREWAIETGGIEKLYQISDETTRTLIEQGFDPVLLSHEDVGRSPDEVIDIIKNQHEVIAGLYQFASGERDLGKSYIRELHQVLTAHQPTYDAIDSLGNPIKPELPRGIWKKLPNNVGNPNEGYYFEFCPPEQVDSEIERLLQFHREHERIGVPPDLEAAWIHHRFTLIHPFTDGNGRVARCLATLILLKARWLPLIVTRREGGYIGAIRQADHGDLRPLVELFGTLQKRAVLKAFSLSDELPPGGNAISTILGAVRTRFGKSRARDETVTARVLNTGAAVHRTATDRLSELATEIDSTVRDLGSGFRAFVQSEVGGGNEIANRFVTISAGLRIKSGIVFNFEAYQAWARVSILTSYMTEIAFSFHGIGRDFVGVLGVYAAISNRPADEPGWMMNPVYTDLLSEMPFMFTYTEPEAAVIDRFRPWLEDQLICGLDNWRVQIGA